MTPEELRKALEKIRKDPDLWKKVEEYQKEYGELTEEELRERFTI